VLVVTLNINNPFLGFEIAFLSAVVKRGTRKPLCVDLNSNIELESATIEVSLMPTPWANVFCPGKIRNSAIVHTTILERAFLIGLSICHLSKHIVFKDVVRVESILYLLKILKYIVWAF
jgi:hypothetical protein